MGAKHLIQDNRVVTTHGQDDAMTANIQSKPYVALKQDRADSPVRLFLLRSRLSKHVNFDQPGGSDPGGFIPKVQEKRSKEFHNNHCFKRFRITYSHSWQPRCLTYKAVL